jgi:MFS family permease
VSVRRGAGALHLWLWLLPWHQRVSAVPCLQSNMLVAVMLTCTGVVRCTALGRTPAHHPGSGDTRGRRLALLLSICLMGVPTVLIGCLPTYAHIGIAAPILLALLRLVQGVAMGGEVRRAARRAWA